MNNRFFSNNYMCLHLFPQKIQHTCTYSSSTKFQQDVHMLTIFKESLEPHNMLVTHTSVNFYLLCHLKIYNDSRIRQNFQCNLHFGGLQLHRYKISTRLSPYYSKENHLTYLGSNTLKSI